MKGQPRYIPGELVPGTIYRVVRLLGAGGMGTVYEVEDTTVGKHYVLKTLNAELAQRADLHERMQTEARTLARLCHPNIVEVVTAGATCDALRLPFIVMEKLNGHPLRTVLERKGGLPVAASLGIAIDLLEALEHAHKQGVIHRDVKPDNIFLHRQGNGAHITKLLDFGVLMLIAETTSNVGRRFVGTFRYASPEQLRGDNMTPRSDLYSVGLVLYEMLAGHGPFDDRTESGELAEAHIHAEVPPLPRHVKIPETLRALLTCSLAKSPLDRPASASSFARSLRKIEHAVLRSEGGAISERFALLPSSRRNRPRSKGAPTGLVPAKTLGFESLPQENSPDKLEERATVSSGSIALEPTISDDTQAPPITEENNETVIDPTRVPVEENLRENVSERPGLGFSLRPLEVSVFRTNRAPSAGMFVGLAIALSVAAFAISVATSAANESRFPAAVAEMGAPLPQEVAESPTAPPPTIATSANSAAFVEIATPKVTPQKPLVRRPSPKRRHGGSKWPANNATPSVSHPTPARSGVHTDVLEDSVLLTPPVATPIDPPAPAQPPKRPGAGL